MIIFGWGLINNTFAQNFVEDEKITPETRAEKDQFGSSVCFENGQLFVGAIGEKEDADEANPLEGAGAVFVYERQSDEWGNVQKLIADDREAGDKFGFDIDVSGDYLVIGADNQTKNSSGEAPLTSAGAAYIFKKNTSGQWEQIQKIVPSDRAENDRFGASVAIDGNYMVVGAPSKNNSQGAAYVFEKNASDEWKEAAILTSMKSFYPTYGRDVDISGDRIIVGSPSQIYSTTDPVYHYNFAGMAFIYERDGSGNWNEVHKTSSSDVVELDHFATSVALSGDFALVGTPDKKTDEDGKNSLGAAGAVYVLHRDNEGNWKETQKITPQDRAENDQFGSSVSLSGNTGVIGSWWDDHDADNKNTMDKSGSAYIIEKAEDDTWAIVQKIVAKDRSEGASFGNEVHVNGSDIIVGVAFEDYNSQGTDLLDNAGAVYAFEKATLSVQEISKTTSSDMHCYPNPASGNLTIQTPFTIQSVKMYDVSGKLVKQIANIEQSYTTIDISQLQSGMYYIQITDGKGSNDIDKVVKY